MVGPTATLTMSTAALTAATRTIQLTRSSSPAIQMPSAAAKTTLATFAAGTQPSHTNSTASGRAARATSGRRRPSARSGSMPQTSAATAVSTTADETMMSSRMGSDGRWLLPKPQPSSTAVAARGRMRRFMRWSPPGPATRVRRLPGPA